MLPMIAKMVTRDERQKYRIVVAFGVVRIIVPASRLTVRQIGAEIKQLQCAEQRRCHPKEQQIRNGNIEQMVQNIKDNRHADNLFPGDISEQKMQIPGPKAAVCAIVIIGIFERAGKLMMIKMFGTNFIIREQGIDKQTKLANGGVNFVLSRYYSSVNGIVSSDKNPRI